MKTHAINSILGLFVLTALACNFGSRSAITPTPVDPTPDPPSTSLPPPDPTRIIIIQQPKIYNFLACYDPCLENGANSSRIFSGGTQKIYLKWNYEAIPEDADYVRAWTVNGEEWVRYECTWPGPETGVAEVELREPGGLYSGTWEVKIIVNGAVLLQQQLFLDGDWSYWDRAGTFKNCG